MFSFPLSPFLHLKANTLRVIPVVSGGKEQVERHGTRSLGNGVYRQ